MIEASVEQSPDKSQAKEYCLGKNVQGVSHKGNVAMHMKIANMEVKLWVSLSAKWCGQKKISGISGGINLFKNDLIDDYIWF